MGTNPQQQWDHTPCCGRNSERCDHTVQSSRERLRFLTLFYCPTQPSPGALRSPVLCRFPSSTTLETLGQVRSKSLNNKSLKVADENSLGFYIQSQTNHRGDKYPRNRIARVCDRILDEALSAMLPITGRIWTRGKQKTELPSDGKWSFLEKQNEAKRVFLLQRQKSSSLPGHTGPL